MIKFQTNKNMEALSRIPSRLLKVAIADMKISMSQGINIDMSAWGSYVGPDDCSVCMAGATMLQTLKMDIKSRDTYCPESNDKNWVQLNALDKIRSGKFHSFLKTLNCEDEYQSENKYSEPVSVIPDWKFWGDTTPEEFFEQIEDLIEHLESQGL